MMPILGKWGPITIHTYGLLVAGAALVGWWIGQRNARQLGLPEDLFGQVAWWTMVGAVVGGRLAYVALHPAGYLDHPWDILKLWEGGMVFYGGLLVALIAVVVCIRVYRRVHGLRHDESVCVWRFADAIAPAVALGHAIGRLGCFAAGCCYGRPTNLPWGITFRHSDSLAPLGLRLHPTQLYEAAVNLGIFGFLQWRLGTARLPGEVLSWYLGLYAVARFLLEWWRNDDRGPWIGGFSPSQWVAIGCLGGVALWRWFHHPISRSSFPQAVSGNPGPSSSLGSRPRSPIPPFGDKPRRP